MADKKQVALTQIELLVRAAVLTAVTGLIVSGIVAARKKTKRIQCVNRLMQVGM